MQAWKLSLSDCFCGMSPGFLPPPNLRNNLDSQARGTNVKVAVGFKPRALDLESEQAYLWASAADCSVFLMLPTLLACRLAEKETRPQALLGGLRTLAHPHRHFQWSE